MSEPTPPLYVDLDDCLIRTDLLLETWLGFLKTRPWLFFMPLLWLLRSRAHLKAQLATHALPDPATLPYHPEFLNALTDMQQRGRSLHLATAADIQAAEAVAAHLNLFKDVLASDGKRNLKGSIKATAIIDHAGGQPFHYAGDSVRDLPVWRAAQGAITVGVSPQLAKKVAKETPIVAQFQTVRAGMRAWVRALRVHQWVKNMLVFIPLLTAHQFLEPRAWLQAAIAATAFCAVASGTYIINDLLDLGADRLHPRKRKRPFAVGDLSIGRGLLAAAICIAAGHGLTLFLQSHVTMLLTIYVVISLTYSLYLKTLPLVDVFVLAGLFTMRIFCGAEAIDVPLSHWLLGFSMFFFISLAMVKRYAELHNLARKRGQSPPGRGYRVEDLEHLGTTGFISGGLAVLIMALYITSDDVTRLYNQPHWLWFICPLLFYWLSWVWLVARRGQMHDDPVLFAVKDRTSYFLGFIVAAVLLFAI